MSNLAKAFTSRRIKRAFRLKLSAHNLQLDDSPLHQQRCTAVALNPATTSTPTASRSSRTDRAVTAATIGVPLASTVTRVSAPAGTISTNRPAKLILHRRHRRLGRQRHLLGANHGVGRTRDDVAERIERQRAGRERDGVLHELIARRRRPSRAPRRESDAPFRQRRSRRRESRRCTATPVCETPLGIALLHDAPAVEHDRDVAEQSGFGEIVRHLQHGESALEVDRAQNARARRCACADRAR